jgi:TIR domain-containing protein
MHEVFLSYAREDRERAESFAAALAKCGVSVWWDRKILPGKSFDAVIEGTLRQVQAAIVLWSRDSVQSRWVKEEASRALQREILIPVLIDDVELPLGFSMVQTADLRGWSGALDHPELADLLASLSELLGRPLAPLAPEEGPARPPVAQPVPAASPVAPPPQPAPPARAKGESTQEKAKPRDETRPAQWHAKLVDRGLNRIVVKVRLTHDTHQVELVHHIARPVNAESLLVDGAVVAQGGTAISWRKDFDFTLQDGPAAVPAKVEIQPNIWLGTLAKFRLTVGGRVLFKDGDW